MEEGGEEVNVRDQEGDGEPALELGAQAAQGGAEELVHQARGRTSRAVALALALAVAVAVALALALALLLLLLLHRIRHQLRNRHEARRSWAAANRHSQQSRGLSLRPLT